MDEIYANVENDKPSLTLSETPQTGSKSSRRGSHRGILVFLGLLSVFLLAGVIILSVLYHNTLHDLKHIAAHLLETELQLSSMTEERNSELGANLTEMTKEMENLRNTAKQKTKCPEGWKTFSRSCYLLSTKPASWDAGRKDCRDRGGDLVVIDSSDEQTFLLTFNTKSTWIGLSDNETEGTWKWVDGSPLTLSFWGNSQPDNGGGQEDCAHIRTSDNHWNDLRCDASFHWVCEKQPI